MDERTARKLRAAAEFERRQADAAADAVGRLEGKVERARADLAAAEEALDAARLEASEADRRACDVEQAAAAAGLEPGRVAGDSVMAAAGVAAGKGGV